MIEFLKSTSVAANALYGDFKFKAYYNSGFQMEALTTFVCHTIRTLYNLAATLLCALMIVGSLFNPFAWLGLPQQGLNFADNIISFAISAVTVVLHPIIFVLRSLSSIVFGYEEGTLYDCGIEGEEADLTLAMAFC